MYNHAVLLTASREIDENKGHNEHPERLTLMATNERETMTKQIETLAGQVTALREGQRTTDNMYALHDQRNPLREVQCYKCKEYGHYASSCTRKSSDMNRHQDRRDRDRDYKRNTSRQKRSRERSRSRGRSQSRERSRKSCGYCKRMGKDERMCNTHAEDECGIKKRTQRPRPTQRK